MGHLGGDVGVCTPGLPGILGTPAVASRPLCLASGSLATATPAKVCRVAVAALELLRRAVFQKARSASHGPHGSLPISGWSGPGPHLPCSDEQRA